MKETDSSQVLRNNIFIIRNNFFDGKIAVYAPLHNVAFLCNEAGAEFVLKYKKGAILSQSEIDSPIGQYIRKIELMESVYPTSIESMKVNSAVILLSHMCNLNCSYCYAQESRSKVALSKSNLKAIIDYVISVGHNSKEFVFIGGGEPFITKDRLFYGIEYIRNTSNEAKITITTNATLLSKDVIEFVKRNKVHLGISFDILPEIQNSQRQFANGNPTYDVVASAIDQLIYNDIDFNIRSTITSKNVFLMPEMVEHIQTRFKGVKKLHFEPVSDITENLELFYDDFFNSFFLARKVAKSYDIELYNSITNSINKIHRHFCSGEFCVTPKGDIVLCHRVASDQERLFSEMKYGHITTDSLYFDEDKKSQLLDRLSVESSDCKSCFAKFHCAGGCFYDRLTMSHEQNIHKCHFIKRMLSAIIIERLTIKTKADEK